MAEIIATLGTIATVIQITEFAASASVEFYDFLRTIQNAPREITSIMRDIESFNRLVCNLKSSLSSADVQEIVKQDVEISKSLHSLEQPMQNCCDVFQSLMRKMRPHLKEESRDENGTTDTADSGSGSSSAAGNKLNRTIKRGGVKWYFKRREVYSLIGELERTKVTFADAMGSVTLYVFLLFGFIFFT